MHGFYINGLEYICQGKPKFNKQYHTQIVFPDNKLLWKVDYDGYDCMLINIIKIYLQLQTYIVIILCDGDASANLYACVCD